MKVKRISILLIIFFLSSFLLNYMLLNRKLDDSLDVVAVNEIIKTYEGHWKDFISRPNRSPYILNKLDYAILDDNNNLLVQTKEGITTDINLAIGHRDTIVDIREDGKIVGKAIIYNSVVDKVELYLRDVFISTSLVLFIVLLMCIIYLLYLNSSIINPFRKLKTFASSVSHGNFELPLNMDRNNLFGAFTESFDIMREELLKARNNERAANQSKKELIAELSHDIKTPVASIKAIAELMLMRIENKEGKEAIFKPNPNGLGYAQMEGKMIEQLETIGTKADQINLLISNMFHATLEELKELKVEPQEAYSTIIKELIKNADYDKKTTVCEIPECLILCDTLRLQQVFDNIISNSYKYGGNHITVTSQITKKRLVLTFMDYGSELMEEDIPLIFHKFYRGNNMNGQGGSGLGLYISKYFLEQMHGDISCENSKNGLIIKIGIKIV
jgi:signal transduction histidine kinase